MIKEYVSYIKDNPERFWFKRKLYGWGWTPATREGWAVIAGYIAGIFYLLYRIDPNLSPEESLATYLIPFLFLTAILLGICFKKGEKPRWQWGVEKHDHDETK